MVGPAGRESAARRLVSNGWELASIFTLPEDLREEVLENLFRLRHVERFGLLDSGLDHDGASVIAATLSHVTHLELASNSLQHQGIEIITSGLRQLTHLGLRSNGIEDRGAEEIASSLGELSSLDLADNRIGVDGANAVASGLPQLTALDLASNLVGLDGAKAIASSLPELRRLNLSETLLSDEAADVIASRLPQLRSLSLVNNRVGTEGAKAIASRLRHLTGLDLADNRVGIRGSEAIASNLHQLRSLNLAGNMLSDEAARAIASSLRDLTSLDLANNQVGEEGAKSVLDAYMEGALEYLDLRGNPLDGVVLPPELLQTTDAQSILAAYRRFASTPEVELHPLNEAKLLVVGNEAVGKTSLVRFLLTGEPRDPTESKTSGTAIQEQIETHTWREEGSLIQLNVWDFGGQEIMHGTHRFFLSERSLYLLVLEARREDDTSVFNWLKTIRNRGGDSPVIVVINKCDNADHHLRVDLTALQRDYSNIVGVVTTSCDATQFGYKSVADLRELIASTLASDARLAHVRDPIPQPWVQVKTKVTALARERSLLESHTFVELCEEGDGRNRISDLGEQTALLRLLHDLGVVVAHGLARDAPAALREVTLLDPNWLTRAIYALLNEPQILRQEGEFSRGELPLWLDADIYPSERHEYILGMMQSSDLGLCFPLPADEGEERYLLPEALPSSEPDYETWPLDSLRFRYEYDYLPPSMIPRLIVQAHHHLTSQPTRWRTGVVLAVEKCPVLIRGDRERRRIDIFVAGPADQRRPALAVIRDLLSVVHKLNPEAGPSARVPLPDDPDKSVGYDWLIGLEQRAGGDHRFYAPDKVTREYAVGELLQGVRTDGRSWRPSSAQTSSDSKRLPYTVAEALRLGSFMLASLVIVIVAYIGAYRLAGSGAVAVTTSALAAVVIIAAFILFSSGLLSEGGLLEVLRRDRRGE